MKNMTTGNVYGLILRFALPVFISQLFQQLYNAVDSMIVGKFLGTEALAAVSSSGTLIFLLVSFFEGVAVGAGVLISRKFGENDADGVSRAVHTDLALAGVCGIVLTLVGVFCTPTFLRWIRIDPDVFPQAVSYFRYYFLGALSLVIYNMCRGIMMAVGDSRRPLYYLIFSSCVNVVLDLLFVGAFHWGVWSAAFATVIAQTLSAVLCLVQLSRKGSAISIEFRRIRFYKAELLQTLRYGIPSGVQNSVIGFANVIVQSQINSFGTVATAAYGTHSKIEGFAFLPITSFNMASTTFVSQNLGARQYGRAKRGARFSILAAMLLAELVGVGYVTGSRFLFGLFTSDAAVLDMGAGIAQIVTPFYFLLAFSHAVAAVCRGAGKAVVPMTVMLSVWCVFRVSYIITVMHFFGTWQLIYWAYPITWGISSVIYLFYYLFSDWVHGFEKEKT